jgi:hypothetical protein
MRIGSGRTSQNLDVIKLGPVPVPIFSQALTALDFPRPRAKQGPNNCWRALGQGQQMVGVQWAIPPSTPNKTPNKTQTGASVTISQIESEGRPPSPLAIYGDL